MKQKLLEILMKQKKNGDGFMLRLENISNINELDDLVNEYNDWDKINLKVLGKGYVYSQLFQMYSGVNYLGNSNINSNSFQGKRDDIKYCLPKKLNHLNTAVNYTNSATNSDILPLEDEILISETNPQKTNDMKKLFLSHSSEDAKKIAPFIDLIHIIGVQENQIFFSSNPAYGVDLGENIFERFKKELNNDIFALFILSENFYKSPVCLCEMGAVWIKSNKQIPILIPPFDFKDVKGVFPNSLGFKINDKDQLNSLKVEIEKYFGLTSIHLSRWEKKRDEFLTKVNALLL
jgi:hypothetical protein